MGTLLTVQKQLHALVHLESTRYVGTFYCLQIYNSWLDFNMKLYLMHQLSLILQTLVPASEFNYMGQSSASSTKKGRGTGTKWLEDMAEYSVPSEAPTASASLLTTQKPKDVTSQPERTTTFTNTLLSEANAVKTKLQAQPLKKPTFQGMPRSEFQSSPGFKSDFDKSTSRKLLPSTEVLTTTTATSTPDSEYFF